MVWKRIYPVSSSTFGENALLMPEVKWEWLDCFKPLLQLRYVEEYLWRQKPLHLKADGQQQQEDYIGWNSCQLRTTNWGYKSDWLINIGQPKTCFSDETRMVLYVLWSTFSWHTVGPLVSTEHRLKATANLRILADHVDPTASSF